MGKKLPLIIFLTLTVPVLLRVWEQASLAAAIPARYVQDVWTTEKGLPQNSVTAILQTRDGYLWVGTFGGLARFDGLKFTIFDTGNSPGLKSNRIIALFEDHTGVLWIGTEQGGLSRYDHGTFTTYTTKDGLPDNHIYSITEDAQGDVWIATSNGVAQLSNERFSTYTTRDGLADNRVLLISAGRNGRLWLLSDKGLTCRQDGRFSSYALPEDNTPRELIDSRSLFEAPDGRLWIAGTRFFARFLGGNFTFYTHQEPQNVDEPVSIFRAPSGELRFLMPNSFAGFDGGEVITNPSLSHAAGAKALIQDREGNVWVGSSSDGLQRYKLAQVTSYTAEDGLSDEEFLVIAGDGGDGLWLASQNLFHFSDGRFTNFTNFPIRPGVTGFWALLQDRHGTVWTGSYGGLHEFPANGHGSPITYQLNANNGLSGSPLTAIYEDRQGRLWIGTGSDAALGGLHLFKDGVFTPFRTAQGLTLTDVRFITEDRAGALWLGGVSGMSRYQGGTFTNYTTAQGLSNDYVRDIYQDAEGTFWIGTYGGGLNRFKDGRFTHITTKEGLFDNIISRILEDDNGNLWMSCNRGIFRASRKDLNDVADGRQRSVYCISYSVADGMKTNETNGGCQPAGWKDRDGRLWFPTIKGVAMIDPRNLNKLPPPVVVEQVLIDKTPVDSRQVIEMRPGQNDLEIHYTGLSLSAPEKVRFKYKLEGYDRDWVDAKDRRVAYYTQVAPGTYSFKVMAATNDGVWSTHDATVQLTVIPPYWRTWWFSILAGLGVLAGLFLLYKQRIRELERRRRTQEEFSHQLIASQEGERKRIAAELHDSLGQELLIIKNRAALSLKMLGDTDRAQEQIEQIAGTASQAITEVRQIAYNLRPYHLDEIGLSQSLEELIERVANAYPIKFTSHVDNIDDLFSNEAAINLYRIVQEGLNNIVKHSEASEARLLVRRNSREIEMVLEDNGKGFSQPGGTARRPGFGLTGLAERARILRGTLSISSLPDKGTTVKLDLRMRGTNHEA